MILQLNPSIPVITPKGKAIAHAIIDSGIEHDLLWICFQDSNGECWTWKNTQVRAQLNITHGRDFISPFYNPSKVGFSKQKQKLVPVCWQCGEILDEAVQDEEIDEECEEGSEEEDFENDYIIERIKNKELMEKLQEIEKDVGINLIKILKEKYGLAETNQV